MPRRKTRLTDYTIRQAEQILLAGMMSTKDIAATLRVPYTELSRALAKKRRVDRP